jgi:hypothetical protein
VANAALIQATAAYLHKLHEANPDIRKSESAGGLCPGSQLRRNCRWGWPLELFA